MTWTANMVRAVLAQSKAPQLSTKAGPAKPWTQPKTRQAGTPAFNTLRRATATGYPKK